MAPAPPTVSSLKLGFLSVQTSALSRPPVPSRSWQTANEEADQPLPARAVDDALLALGQSIQQHCRRVYAPQASRHVADQISNVYAREAERRFATQGETDALAVGKEVDLVDDDTIEILPSAWPVQRQVTDHPLEAKRYADTVSRLVQLKQERRQSRQRVERLRRLKQTINTLATTQVQENLVTRNGPVESELEKMRFLLARVAGRVSELRIRKEVEVEVEVEVEDGEMGGGGGGVNVADLAQTRRKSAAVDEFFGGG